MKREILVDPFGRTTIFYILDKDMYEITEAPEEPNSILDLPDSGDNN